MRVCLQQGVDVDVFNNDNTLGFHLDLYTRYTDSLKVQWQLHYNNVNNSKTTIMEFSTKKCGILYKKVSKEISL